MKKQKNKSIYPPLVTTGYVLFAFLIVTTILMSAPLFAMVFNPDVLRFNVIFFAVTLTIGSLLPVIVGYIIGDHSVKSKSKAQHHFSGVLFGLLTYWIVVSPVPFTLFSSDLFGDAMYLRMATMSIAPSIAVAFVTTLLAIAHVRSKKAKHDIIEYAPFAWVLIGLITFTVLASIIYGVTTNTLSIHSFIALIIITLFGGISYVSLRKAKLTHFAKLTWTAVSISVLFATLYVTTMFISTVSSYVYKYPTAEYYVIESLVCFGVALAAWIGYWVVQVKAFPKAKK